MTQTNGRPAIRDRRDAKLPYDEWVESIGVPIHRGYFIEDARNIEVGPWEEAGVQRGLHPACGHAGHRRGPHHGDSSGGDHCANEIRPGRGCVRARWTGPHDGVGRGRAEEDLRVGPSQPVPAPSRHVPPVQQTRGGTVPRGWSTTTTSRWPCRSTRTPTSTSTTSMRSRICWRRRRGSCTPSPPGPTDQAGAQPGSATSSRIWLRGTAWSPTASAAAAATSWTSPSRALSWAVTCPSSPRAPTRRGHKHGPGVVIIIPAGEGYSIMWPEGEEKIIVPWHEASMFVPPNQWFHQHFNVSVHARPVPGALPHPPAQRQRAGGRGPAPGPDRVPGRRALDPHEV